MIVARCKNCNYTARYNPNYFTISELQRHVITFPADDQCSHYLIYSEEIQWIQHIKWQNVLFAKKRFLCTTLLQYVMFVLKRRRERNEITTPFQSTKSSHNTIIIIICFAKDASMLFWPFILLPSQDGIVGFCWYERVWISLLSFFPPQYHVLLHKRRKNCLTGTIQAVLHCWQITEISTSDAIRVKDIFVSWRSTYESQMLFLQGLAE